ncbi:GNAT family N-acetyltransferase [Phaeovulum sp. W22_SRMD_FR3]|uniref:GNAT family N-acetyltransferase n=1 Tax=Phaeovulum sp. W22_SRMD_FR3 TaxID=3240274 RepID=UPI003F9DDD31
MIPRRMTAEDADLPEILALIRESFAYMDARIDPPSSMHRLTLDDVAQHCRAGEVWAIGAPVQACLFLTPKGDALYLGKLAVAAAARKLGLARILVAQAETRARALGLPQLELQVRVELTENLAAFQRMGFVQVAATAHPGFDRPTSLTLRRAVPRGSEAAAPGAGAAG